MLNATVYFKAKAQGSNLTNWIKSEYPDDEEEGFGHSHGDRQADNHTTVVSQFDFTKIAINKTTDIGKNVTFEIHVKNKGGPLDSITIQDVFDKNLTYLSYNATLKNTGGFTENDVWYWFDNDEDYNEWHDHLKEYQWYSYVDDKIICKNITNLDLNTITNANQTHGFVNFTFFPSLQGNSSKAMN